jgi:glucose uptake protein GlcU
MNSPRPSSANPTTPGVSFQSVHGLGVVCALAAGVWLGAAEAPTKLVNSGLSPFAISLCMVAGVFTARWTVPTLLKGTRYVFADLAQNKHLILNAIVAGMLWAVANTLTVFAIRDVGLTIAFPLWNTNSLVGILWGRLLFGELKGASTRNILKVLFGAVAIILAAILLGFSTIHGAAAHAPHAVGGILAAAGASLLWGTMYIPYRKAYVSGMNPLSFVTVFTIGELGTCFALVLALDGGTKAAVFHSPEIKHLIWVIGDLFQQFATKYLGIGRAIPLSNTNQLWGLAWGALVFGELAHADGQHRLLVITGSLVMILGALSVSTAVATAREHQSINEALLRECCRYKLDYDRVVQSYAGSSPAGHDADSGRHWWDYLIVTAALGVFVYFAINARVPSLGMNFTWLTVLAIVLIASALVGGYGLWKATRFS